MYRGRCGSRPMVPTGSKTSGPNRVTPANSTGASWRASTVVGERGGAAGGRHGCQKRAAAASTAAARSRRKALSRRRSTCLVPSANRGQGNLARPRPRPTTTTRTCRRRCASRTRTTCRVPAASRSSHSGFASSSPAVEIFQARELLPLRDDLPRSITVGVGGRPDQGQLLVRGLLGRDLRVRPAVAAAHDPAVPLHRAQADVRNATGGSAGVKALVAATLE